MIHASLQRRCAMRRSFFVLKAIAEGESPLPVSPRESTPKPGTAANRITDCGSWCRAVAIRSSRSRNSPESLRCSALNVPPACKAAPVPRAWPAGSRPHGAPPDARRPENPAFCRAAPDWIGLAPDTVGTVLAVAATTGFQYCAVDSMTDAISSPMMLQLRGCSEDSKPTPPWF
jgi:hypothetical protein